MPNQDMDFGDRLERLEQVCPTLPNEATLLHEFLVIVREMLEQKGLTLTVHVDANHQSLRGRPDARVGSLIFEAKRPDVPLAHAITQIQRRFCESSGPGVLRGIAYNGVEIAFILEDGTTLCRGKPAELAGLLETWLTNLAVTPDAPEDIVQLVGVTSGAARMAIKVFWTAFRHARMDVGFVDEAFQIWQGLYSCAVNLNEDVREDVKRSASHLGLNLTTRRDVEEFVFCLQTYFTTLLRLLLAKGSLLCGLIPGASLRDAIGSDPVDGIVDLDRRSPGVVRLFEPDAFLWFHDAYRFSPSPNIRRHLQFALAAMTDCVDFLDLRMAGKDFLRTTYQRMFDPSMRRALGEFYTPAALVEETLDQAGYRGQIHKRLIDFACGSGGFLIAAIRRKLARNSKTPPAKLLDDIISTVEGMDIHPLAVAMTKVNYLLAISDLLRQVGNKDNLFIPVYWGDCLMRVRRGQTVLGLVTLHVPGMGKIELPSSNLLDWEFLFSALAATMSRLRVPDEDMVFTELSNRYHDAERDLELLRAEDHVRRLVRQIVERERRQRDMRWLPLLRNAVVLEMKSWQEEDAGSGFDYVVGNPPWVRIHNLAQDLKEQLRRFGYRFFTDGAWKWGAHLSGGPGFANQADYSVVFVERALDLLRPGGVVSLILTSKVSSALYAGALRSSVIHSHRIMALSDYSLHPTMMFEGAINYPLIVSVERADPSSAPGAFSDNVIGLTVHWPDGTNNKYRRRQGDLGALPMTGPETSGAPWALVPPGVHRMIAKMQLVGATHLRYLGQVSAAPVSMGVKTGANQVFLADRLFSSTRCDEVIAELEGLSNARVGDRQTEFRVRVPLNILRPVVRGQHIRAWHVPTLSSPETHQSILWPHEDETGAVIQAERLPSTLTEYFERHRETLIRRADYKNTDPIWKIYRVSSQKLGAKVVWSEMARSMRACFLPARVSVPGHERPVPIVPLQTAYLIPVVDEEAGYFISAILNSSPVRAFFCSFAERAQNAYFRHYSWVVSLLPLGGWAPLLDSGFSGLPDCSSLVQKVAPELVRISRLLHSVDGQSKQLLDKLDRLVCDLYGLDIATDLVQAKAYLQKLGATADGADVALDEEEEGDAAERAKAALDAAPTLEEVVVLAPTRRRRT